MKKLFALLIAAVFVLSAFAGCTNKNGKTDVTTNPPATNPESTPGSSVVPALEFDTWVSEGYEKVTGEAAVPRNPVTDISLYMAKNEKEGFNISVRFQEAVEGLKIVLAEGNENELKIEYFDLHLVPAGEKHYPDGMVPYKGSFNAESRTAKTILVRFVSNADTDAGEYKFKFAVQTADGKNIAEYNATVNVWDFALPETLTSVGTTGIDRSQITSKEKIPGAQAGKYYRMYYELMLQYGMSGYSLPYDILNEKCDEYLDDPRLKAFVVPYNVDDETLVKYYEKLCTKEEWLEKAYFYPFDEPTSLEHLATLAERCQRLQELAPKIRVCIPFFRNIKVDNNTDEVQYLDDYLGIWCPKSVCWAEGWLPDPNGNGYFGNRMDEQKAQGDKVWWYVCWEPGYPYCNLYVNEVGIQHVQLFWQQYIYGTEGLLYWASTHWGGTDNPWTDIATVKGLSPTCFGDGSLLYPGNYVGVDGPVASFRLECIRSGMEDYDLLLLAEEYMGRDWALEQAKIVSESLSVHTRKNQTFNETRKAIGDAIEAAVKAKG